MTATCRRRGRRKSRRPLLWLCLGLAVTALALGLAALRLTGEPEAADTVLPDYVECRLIPVNHYSRPGAELEDINGVVVHYVGNPATSAEANRSYFASLADGREGTYASSHFIVGLEGEVLQCVPLTEVAYATKDRNGDTVSIEVCHPDDTGEFSEATEVRLIELTAWLCQEFDVDTETQLLRHYDVTGKECPRWYVKNPEAWEAFRVAVEAEMERQAGS